METTLRTDVTIGQICEGFVYNELEGRGLYGLSGALTIQPEYQRNYIHADGRKDVAVIEQSPVIDVDFSGLNPEQYKATTFDGRHLLVLAGAGTGKTRTIIARAVYLLQQGENPEGIKILSFTNKSANT